MLCLCEMQSQERARVLRRVKKYLLHLRGVPPGELALQGGALEAQPQRALLCRGARQALTTLRTTLTHEALHLTSEDHAALLKPSCLILQWQRGVSAMLGHWADSHRPVDTEMPTTLQAVRVRLQAHQERQPCEASEAPQTAEALPRYWEANAWHCRVSAVKTATRQKLEPAG